MHYSVLVIGPDPSRQMAPFDASLEVDPYDAPCWDCEGNPKFHPCEECASTGTVKSTRNPRAEFDYARLGGRYRGFLRLQPGAPGVLGPPAWEWTDFPSDLKSTDWTDRADQAPRSSLDMARIASECFEESGVPYRTYGILADGVWRSREGGPSKANDWVTWWDRIVASLPGDTLLSVYDIHD